MPDFLLEIAAYSIQAALAAEAAGANRIELCQNPAEGGTTPSYGVLKKVKEKVSIPIFPIIRPRGGHFVFSSLEIEAMQDEIKLCKDLDFEGVVIGLLKEDATVDYDNTSRLVELAYPLDVTFHRAFDRTPDAFEALETIIRTGCTRILTSGQVPDVNQGANLVAGLVKAADFRITIMPGSGVRAKGIAKLAEITGATEFHSSASYWENEPYFSPTSMQEKIQQNKVNRAEILGMVEELEAFFKVNESGSQ